MGDESRNSDVVVTNTEPDSKHVPRGGEERPGEYMTFGAAVSLGQPVNKTGDRREEV